MKQLCTRTVLEHDGRLGCIDGEKNTVVAEILLRDQ